MGTSAVQPPSVRAGLTKPLLLNDPRYKLPLYGLFIALSGVILKASMDLDQIAAMSKIYVDSRLCALSTVIAYLIQGAGLIIVFITGVIKIKD